MKSSSLCGTVVRLAALCIPQLHRGVLLLVELESPAVTLDVCTHICRRLSGMDQLCKKIKNKNMGWGGLAGEGKSEEVWFEGLFDLGW
mgnify:CR=1 FL=1